MDYIDRLLANHDHFQQQGRRVAEKAKAALDAARAELERRDRGAQEAVEEALRNLEDSKSAAEQQAERHWSGNGRVFGRDDDEEPEAGTHVRRHRRDDASTLAFAAGNDEEDKEEEPEPYRRPPRWHDGNAPGDDPTAGRGWGGSIRRIGRYEEDD